MAFDSLIGVELSNLGSDEVMNSRKMIWVLGSFAMLALPVVANAAVTCPSGAGINCISVPSGVECRGDATSDQSSVAINCTLDSAVEASCNNPTQQVDSTELFASHAESSSIPASCTWNCSDDGGTTTEVCVIDQDDGLPVTRQKDAGD